jgi:hypothetical protein
MTAAWFLPVLLMLPGEDAPAKAPPLEDRLRQENLADARLWEMFLDSNRQTKAQLVERPVYLWTNPTKGQFGSVFVWVHEGQPMVVGTIFAHPIGKGLRRMTHEFHSLAPTVLAAECKDDMGQTWEPKAAVTLHPLPDAPKPDASPAKRLIQMRSLGRQFGGHTVDWRKQRWELRLLPQPLYRYEKPPASGGRKPPGADDVLDGALLALVTSAGTDPEVFLLLEARKEGGWHYALLRFADSSLFVHHNEKEIWTSVRDKENTQFYNPDHTYRVFHKRVLDESFETKEGQQP